MTAAAKSIFKNNWLTFANFILLLTLAYRIGVAQTVIEKDIESLKVHTEDMNLHMPLEEKIKTFVPRTELDSRLRNIEKYLEKIDKKIDEK